MATTERAAAIASSVARPNGSTRLGWQRTSDAASQRGDLVVGHPTDEADPGSPLERLSQRPVADERERSLAAALEGAREAEDVLALAQTSETEEGRPLPVPAQLRARCVLVVWREAGQVDPAVDDLGLPVRARNRVLEAGAKPLRHRDHRGGAFDDVARRHTDAGDGADVGDVLPVGGHHERRPRGERGGEARRDEKVRVDDVRVEPPRCTPGLEEEPDVLASPSGAAVDDGTLDLVTTREQLSLEACDEDAEIRIRRTRIHLRDEQDLHRGWIATGLSRA